MSQKLHVLRCFQCLTFQVDIVKKVPKWKCKMCGQNQSIKKVFFIGSGKECREIVQRKNKEQNENLNQPLEIVAQEEIFENSYESEESFQESYESEEDLKEKTNVSESPKPTTSKWDVYLTECDDTKTSIAIEDTQYTFMTPPKKKQKTNKYNINTTSTNNNRINGNEKKESYEKTDKIDEPSEDSTCDKLKESTNNFQDSEAFIKLSKNSKWYSHIE